VDADLVAFEHRVGAGLVPGRPDEGVWAYVGADAPVCPAEQSSALRSHRPPPLCLGWKTGRNYDWLPIWQAVVSKPAAAELAPGRPDEGVWAYVGADARSAQPSEARPQELSPARRGGLDGKQTGII